MLAKYIRRGISVIVIFVGHNEVVDEQMEKERTKI
jgi:hypothetical protein